MFGALLLDLYPLFTQAGRALRQRLLRTGRARPARLRRTHRVRARRLPPLRHHRRAVRAARRRDRRDAARRRRLDEPLAARGRDRPRDAARGRGPGSRAHRRGEPAPAAHVRYRRRSTRTASTSTRSTCSSIGDRPAVPARGPAAHRRRARDRRARGHLRPRRLHAADGHRRDPVDRSSRSSPRATAATTAIHTEMFTTGLMQLHRAGKVTNAHKGMFDGFSICTFALGTTELYDWLDGNEDVRFLPVDVVNAPAAGRGQPRHRLDQRRDRGRPLRPGRRRPHQRPPVLGHRRPRGLRRGLRAPARGPLARLPPGDRGARAARPCPGSWRRVPEGATVTSPRHQVDVVITEHGVAELRGRTTRERAEALAAIAHPDFRAELQAAAARPAVAGRAQRATRGRRGGRAGASAGRPIEQRPPRRRAPRRRHRRASSGSR